MMLTQRRRFESTSEVIEKKKENTARGIATHYIRLVLERKGDERYKVANDLYKYLNGRFRDESIEFQQEFINQFDSNGENSTSNTLYELMNVKDEKGDRDSSREAATLLIVVLTETILSIEGGKRVLRFAHYLLKVLIKMDESTMEMTARGLSYLIQTCKVYAAELVEKCLDQSFEWAVHDHSESGRMACSILLRQLSLSTSTAFFLRVQSYFSCIFRVMRSTKIRVRIAAASSLHSSLSVTSQKEARDKRKWYYTVYQEALTSLNENTEGMNRDERWHCMLLVLNELLRIGDATVEGERIRAIKSIKGSRNIYESGNPLEFIRTDRSVNTVVESRTASRLIQENMSTIWEKIMDTRTSKQPYVISTFIEVVPRLSKWMSSSQLGTAIETLIPLLSKHGDAQLSLGLLIYSNPNGAKKYISTILSFARESLQSYKKKKSEVSSHSYLFILLTLIVRCYVREVSVEMKEILPLLLNIPLCKGLKTVLHEIYYQNEHWRSEVINGLLHQLSIILMGESIMGKTIPSFKSFVSIKIDTSNDSLDRYDLAMRTLGEFNFTRSHLYPFIQYISEGYLVCDYVPLRLSAVKCCIQMLRPFIHEYETVSSDHRIPLLTFIHSILKCLVSVSVVDSDVSVRLCVISELSQGNSSLLSLLSQPSLLEFLRLSLRDDSLHMREAVVSLLSKIAMLNPSLVFPRLRRVLLETIGQLTNSRDAKVEEHSARLISRMTIECPQFMRPYLGSLVQALLPKLKKDFGYVESTVHIVTTMSEVAVVGGSEIVDSLGVIFPLLISYITDSSSLSRREEALRCLCNLSASTTVAVDVYREYPQLMTILLSLMKTEMSPEMRRLTMRILGTLGAIHPYTFKSFCGMVRSESNGTTSGLSLPTTKHNTDSRQDTMELFNYGRCTLDEFYSSITIGHLTNMLENEDKSHNNYEDITHDLIVILRSLGSHSPSFVSKLIPQLISITMHSKREHKEFFLIQLSSLLSILGTQSIVHLDQLFSLIASICKDDPNSLPTIIRFISTITASLQSNMGQFVADVIPYLLDGMKRGRNTDLKLISTCLSSICSMRGSLSCHLHLLIPPIISMVDDSSMEISLRKEALDAMFMICEREQLSDYSPTIIQVWTKAVSIRELQPGAISLLRLMMSTKWKHLDVFQRSIEHCLHSNSIECPEYKEYLRENGEWMRWRGDCVSWRDEEVEEVERESKRQSERVNCPSPLLLPTLSSNHKPNWDNLRRSMDVTLLSSKDDWSEWMLKVRQWCIRFSPSYAIRSVVSLSDIHPQLGIDLFNAAFLSVWCEMSEELQDEVTNQLCTALSSSNSHVKQTILNLCEFMEHCDKGPLLISYQQLGRAAEEIECYAKALRYKELEVKMEKKGEISVDDAHSLINFSNKLNLQEEAVGVITCVEIQKGEISKMMRSQWYEKLNEWEKSLELLKECREERYDVNMEELNEQECKCLEALGKWNELNDKIESYSVNGDNMTVIGARGCWMNGDWVRMEEYTVRVNENTLDGSYLRGVLALKKEDYTTAHSFIHKCRDIHDVQLTGMANESYDRAYPAILILQELTELEEAIEYRLRPERRGRIALLWSRRIQGCRDNVEQWQRLLMLRSLVLSPVEMHSLRVKFASLCRSTNKMSQARSQLSQLMGLSSCTPLHSVSSCHDNPHLSLALSKQLWSDDEKTVAITRLESLSRYFDRWSMSVLSTETRSIAAKTFLKLGEWTEYMQSYVCPTIEGRSTVINKGESTLTLARIEAVHAVNTGLTHRSIREEEERQIDKVIHYYTKTTQYDAEWHKGWHRLATAYFNAISRRKTSEKNGNGDTHTTDYVIEAIRAFTKALQLASGSRLEDTLRLVSLWFEYGEEEKVFEELRHCSKSLPLVMWLEVIPQVMGRLDNSSSSGLLMQQVIVEVAKKYPQSLVYALTVGSKSSNETRSAHASHVLTLLSKSYPTLVNEARMVSDELVRCSILWHELWYESLEEASRLYFQEKDIRGMLEVLEPMHNMLDAGPSTLKEHSFYQTYLCDLDDARKFCLAFERTQNGKELTQAWELYYSIFKRIAVQLKTITSLDLNYISPILQKAKELSLCVPGTFDPSLTPVTIYSFSSHLQVITSKQRPRKMSMRGSDGKEYFFLLKGHEDPRQDERVMQFFGLINTLLSHNGDTARRNVTIERYSITALSQKSGLIGWVPECDTLHSLIKEYREKKKVNLLKEHKEMTATSAHIDQLTLAQKIQLFQLALNTSAGEDLADIIWLKSPSSEVWFERRTNYTRSMACMSMVGHILGLGDRHPSNIMLDRESGKIVHIDFGDCFEVAQSREKYPEKIPFRLTRMLVKAMEVTGIEGNYRLTSERVLRVLRGKKDSLIAVLEAFVYDPLINWRLLDVNKRNPGEKKDTSKVDWSDVNEEVSSRVLDRIKLKLSGREFNLNQETSIKDQVERLVQQATSHSNLAQSYIGWCPFW